MQKRLIFNQEFKWLVAIGVLVTPAALWIFSRSAHSSKISSVLGLLMMAPYVGMTRLVSGLPDGAFWLVFFFAQGLYILVVYLALRTCLGGVDVLGHPCETARTVVWIDKDLHWNDCA
jgi:hypothetical protein